MSAMLTLDALSKLPFQSGALRFHKASQAAISVYRPGAIFVDASRRSQSRIYLEEGFSKDERGILRDRCAFSEVLVAV
jgi:hypothetical protein